MNIDDYQMIWDCHTHSIYSKDGHGTIEENVKQAVSMGLKKIAVTEHGFNHLYGIKREDVAKLRAEVERLKKLYPIEILLGIEANLISYDGDIDLTLEECKLFDIIIMGVHKSAKPKTFREWFTFKLRNMLWDTKSHTKKITDAYIRALQKYPIDIVVHPHNIVRIDVVRLAEEAVKHNTLIELNNKHMLLTEDEITQMANIGASFIIDSDAHKSENVGNCPNVFEFLRTHKVPLDKIVNLKKVNQTAGQK